MAVPESARLEFAPVGEEHLQPFLRLALDPRMTMLVGHGRPWSERYARREFGSLVDHWEAYGFGGYALAYKHEFAGLVSLSLVDEADRSAVELGWWIAPSFWGDGLAQEAAHAAALHAESELGAQRLIARCRPDNLGSRRVAESLGMQLEGTQPRKHGGGPSVVYRLELPVS